MILLSAPKRYCSFTVDCSRDSPSAPQAAVATHSTVRGTCQRHIRAVAHSAHVRESPSGVRRLAPLSGALWWGDEETARHLAGDLAAAYDGYADLLGREPGHAAAQRLSRSVMVSPTRTWRRSFAPVAM